MSGLSPKFERLQNLLAREEMRKKHRQTARIKTLTTGGDLTDGPPPEPEVVFTLEVDPPRAINYRSHLTQMNRCNHLVLQSTCSPVAVRYVSPPSRFGNEVGANKDICLLPKLSNYSVDISFVDRHTASR